MAIYSNNIFFMIILFVLLLLITLLIVFLKKVKHGWIYLIAVLLALFCGNYIHGQIVHATFYKLNQEFCEIYPEIEKVEYISRYRGQIGNINVYMKVEAEDERVESIFIDLMKKVNQPPLSQYLKKRASSEYLILEIDFYGIKRLGSFKSEQYQRSDWFTEENQEIQIWKNRNNHKIYRYFDYLD